MSQKISLYPKISKNKAAEFFTVEDPSFSYTSTTGKNSLSVNMDDRVWSLSDEQGIWSADDQNLIIEWKLACEYAESLYLDETDAIACHDAKIGIALQWYSQTSRQRGTVPFGTIEPKDELQEFKCKTCFPKGTMRGKIGMSIILYIKEAGTPTEEELFYANTPGFIIGNVADQEIIVDGNGSFFSIFEVSLPGEPLWNVEYDMDDPETDSFSDCVSINLNKANKRYEYIDKKSKKFDPQLLIEIMSNGMQIVIETIRQEDPDFNCLENPEEGTVAQAVLYFRDVLGWEISSPLKLSTSIRNYIEKNMKEL